MSNEFSTISNVIRNELNRGIQRFLVFPYGEMGVLTSKILREQYGISDVICFDNSVYKYNKNIHPIEHLGGQEWGV